MPKRILKLRFAPPEPVLQVQDTMHVLFPYLLIEEILGEEAPREKPSEILQINVQQIETVIDNSLLERWHFKPWMFHQPDYYNNLYKILFYYLKSYLSSSFPHSTVPPTLTVQFNDADFPGRCTLDVKKLESPATAMVKIVVE